MAPVKLTYFPLQGLGEPIRFLLSYAGEEFIDERIPFDQEWNTAVKHKMPFGKLPVLEINGKTVTQTRAICRYYAKKTGTAGEDDWEALLIDSAADTIDDFKTAIGQYIRDSDESSKAKKYDLLVKETIPFYLERFERQVKDNGGYFVNGKLSWADFFFVGLIDTLGSGVKMNLVENSPNLKALRDKVLALPAIKAWVAKRPASNHLGLD